MADELRTAPPPTGWDRCRGVLSRWGFGRGSYRVAPGLYAVGTPGPEAPVLVTANYKLSFDAVRRSLAGRDAWLLVLDTVGINVWCAAGKGTFGTEELVLRVRTCGLGERVRHRTLVLPQLGAPGVAGFEVARRTGFKVVYGPVRAGDIGAFLDGGMKATDAMRRVEFPLAERLMLAPLELLQALPVFAAMLLPAAAWTLARGGSAGDLAGVSWTLFGAVAAGAVLVPGLLPWLPFRAFALKGWLAGLAWALFAAWARGMDAATTAAAVLFLPAVSAFLALNFTGASTFTSQNGVNKEIRLFVRPMGVCALAGVVLAAVHGVLR
ncbi:MAG: hypothetical protein HY927_13640 [Elusimicrobia bacterium]|nr:hypothetical protein [Elusimicrobiota bacterium]